MKISTVIPAHNRADLIGDTLDSILSQTRRPDEVIVVDDGSSDGTAEAVAAYGDKVTLVRQGNFGAGPARNNGFAKASGDIIHFMDSDDILCPDTYARQAALIEAGNEFVYGPWLKTRFNGRSLDPEPFVMQQRPLPNPEQFSALAVSLGWVTVLQPCMLHRSVVERAGPYRGDLKPSEDTEFLYRVARTVRRIAHATDTILLYRVHPENQVSIQNIDRRLHDSGHLWSLLNAHAAVCDDLSVMRRLTMRCRSAEVARQLRPLDAIKAAEVASGPPAVSDAISWGWRISQRARAKVRMMVYGMPYPRVFGCAPLTRQQIEQIEKAGYHLSGAERAGRRLDGKCTPEAVRVESGCQAWDQ